MSTETSNTDAPLSDLCAWLQSPLGKRIRHCERRYLKAPIATQYGRRLAQLGCLAEDVLTVSAIPHHLHVAGHPALAANADLLASSNALPLEPACLDVLVLHHSLETTNDPHGVLREAERVLAGEGLLLILGFNPWCWWGLGRMVGRTCPPRNVKLLALDRLRDWLKLLDLEVERVETFFSLPPLSNEKLLQRLAFLNRLDTIPLHPLHALYLVHARKHVAPLTPTRLRWKDTRTVLPGLAEPSV